MLELMPEGRLAAAILGKPMTVPDKYRPGVRATVRAAVNSLDLRFRRPLKERFGLPPFDHPVDIKLPDKAINLLREMSSIQDLTAFTPYDPNQLGRMLWEVNFGFELREQLLPLDIERARVGHLSLMPDTAQDVRQFYRHRNVFEMCLARFFRVNGDKFSETSRLDIKQSTEALQKS